MTKIIFDLKDFERFLEELTDEDFDGNWTNKISYYLNEEENQLMMREVSYKNFKKMHEANYFICDFKLETDKNED